MMRPSCAHSDMLEREAKAAADAGQTPQEACRWPFASSEGQRWLAIYQMQRAALDALNGKAA